METGDESGKRESFVLSCSDVLFAFAFEWHHVHLRLQPRLLLLVGASFGKGVTENESSCDTDDDFVPNVVRIVRQRRLLCAALRSHKVPNN